MATKDVTTLVEKTRAQFALNIRNGRAKAKLSQTALAEKAGLSVSYISMLERGMRDPAIESVCALAVALRTAPAKLWA